MSIPGRLRSMAGYLMPGLFLVGYNIGTGSLTAMSKAGANYGTQLLWAVLVSCLITWYLINFFSRFTMASGMTAMQAYHRHLHPAYAWALWGGLAVVILSAVMGMIGLLVDVLVVWFAEVHHQQIPRGTTAVGLAILFLLLIWLGNTKRFEALLSVLVALMGVAFIGSAIAFFPGFDATLRGLVPRLPSGAEGSDNNPYVILASMVGTTVSVFTLLIRSGQVKDHRWTLAQWNLQKRDALVSAAVMFVLSAAVLLTAAATLHLQGHKMNTIAELIPMLRPLFGDWALLVFVVGILAAGCSSHLPNLTVLLWLHQDMQGQPRATNTASAAYALGLLSLVSILGATLATRPVFLLLLSQAGISVVMPLALSGLIWLSSRQELVGNHGPRPIEWLLLAAIGAFSLFMSYLAIQGLVADLQSILK